MSSPLRIAALISGGGRTLMNIADRIEDGSLNASIQIVIASKSNLPGVERSKARKLNTRIIDKRDFPNTKAMHDAVTSALLEHRIELVCLAGYLRLVRVDDTFRGRIMNIHPALLPDFGGMGMYGDRVHAAVLAAGKSTSGCTVHFVDERCDMGPIILQRTCPVLPGDDVHSLAARVFEQECIAYPEAIRLFAQGRLRIEGDRVVILPKHTE